MLEDIKKTLWASADKLRANMVATELKFPPLAAKQAKTIGGLTESGFGGHQQLLALPVAVT